jgi:hypothetical protein
MRRQATKKQVLTTIGILLALVAAGVWWWPHAYWSYNLSRHKFKLAAVKVDAMPPTDVPADWFMCRAGAVSVRLPPSMSEEAERSPVPETDGTILLTTEQNHILLMIPWKLPKQPRPIIEQNAAYLQMTPIEFIAASYETSTNDFRWTMSRTALQRHSMLLELTTVYPHKNILLAETWSSPELEGILVLHEGKSFATFEWRLKSGDAAGFLRFNAKQGMLELEQLRAICQSVRCDPERLGAKLTKEEIAILADTLTIEPGESAVKADDSKKK